MEVAGRKVGRRGRGAPFPSAPCYMPLFQLAVLELPFVIN